MSHFVQALILPSDAARIARIRLRSASLAELARGLLLLPITDDLLRELGDGDPNARALVGRFDGLSARVEELAVSLSAVAAIAYIETEYFGGDGVQGAAIWVDGARRLLFEPCEGYPINEALRLLGVVARSGLDEFDTVGLGAFQRLEILDLVLHGVDRFGGVPPPARVLSRDAQGLAV